MSVSLCLLLAAGFLVACGVYLVTERTLTRIVIGLGLLGNGLIYSCFPREDALVRLQSWVLPCQKCRILCHRE